MLHQSFVPQAGLDEPHETILLLPIVLLFPFEFQQFQLVHPTDRQHFLNFGFVFDLFGSREMGLVEGHGFADPDEGLLKPLNPDEGLNQEHIHEAVENLAGELLGFGFEFLDQGDLLEGLGACQIGLHEDLIEIVEDETNALEFQRIGTQDSREESVDAISEPEGEREGLELNCLFNPLF